MGGTEEPCKTLWVGDIQPSWDEAYVGSLFANTGLEEGDVVEVKLIRDKHTGFPAGYGFVEFSSLEIAEKVLETCNGNAIEGTPFRFRLNWGAGGKRLESVPEFSIFVGDLAPDVTDQMLQAVFGEKYPSTLGAKVVMDPVSGMSKGFGFVRFGDEEEKDQALASMTGVSCGSRTIRVAPATAKKAAGSVTGIGVGGGGMMVGGMHALPHHQHMLHHPHDHVMLSGSPMAGPASSAGGGAAAGGGGGAAGGEGEDPNNTTVFVGGIDGGVTEDVLREAFSGFGDIVYVKIPQGRGCGFVQYVLRASAEAAIAKMQGGDVQGCKVRLSWGRSSPTRSGGRMGGMGVGEGGMGVGGPAVGYPGMYATAGPGAGPPEYYPPGMHLHHHHQHPQHAPHPPHPHHHHQQQQGGYFAPGPMPYSQPVSPYLPPYHQHQQQHQQAPPHYHQAQGGGGGGGGGGNPYSHMTYPYHPHHLHPHSLPPPIPGQERGGYGGPYSSGGESPGGREGGREMGSSTAYYYEGGRGGDPNLPHRPPGGGRKGGGVGGGMKGLTAQMEGLDMGGGGGMQGDGYIKGGMPPGRGGPGGGGPRAYGYRGPQGGGGYKYGPPAEGMPRGAPEGGVYSGAYPPR